MATINISNDLAFAPYQYVGADYEGVRHIKTLICIKVNDIVIKMTDFDKYMQGEGEDEYISLPVHG